MTALEITPLDPFDAGAFDAFYDVYLAAERGLGDVASPWMREEVRVDLQEPPSRRWIGGFTGRVGGDVVAVGTVWTPLLDNLDRAVVAVHVAPEHQRRGHGSAMLDRLEAEASARGRTILGAEASWAHDAGAAGTGAAAPGFAAAHGYALALADVKRELRLPVGDGVLDALAAEAAAHHVGHELRSFVGRIPDDLLEGWARLQADLPVEAPSGELDLEPESADPALVRADEEKVARQGRTKFNTVAIAPDGEVVGITDIATTVHEPGRAYQWGTLVRRRARGRRLGLALKVANLRLLQREAPDVTVLTTYNAEVNTHMIGVNERLGFVPVARLGEFQKVLRTS